MYHSQEITPKVLRQLQSGEDSRLYKMHGSRIVFAKKCEHCYGEYFPNRSDQKYCSDSCRVRACRKRKGYTYQAGRYQKPLPAEQLTLGSLVEQEPNQQEQKFSWQHVGESALGTAAVTGVKYLAHDRPMMQKIDLALQLLEAKQLVHTPLSNIPLQFLRLHKLKKNIIALFRDPNTKELVGCDEKGRWIKQVSAKPERWALIKK